VAENAAAQTAPAAPVVVNVTTAPQPAAPQPAPQKMEAAPVVEKKADEAPAIEEKTQEQPAVEEADPAIELLRKSNARFNERRAAAAAKVDPAIELLRKSNAKITQRRLEREAAEAAALSAGTPSASLTDMPELASVLGQRQLAPPIAQYPQLAPAIPAAIATPVAAPTATPVAAPVTPPALAPVVAPVVRGPLTGAMLADAAAKEPTKTIEQLVVGLTGADPVVVAQTIPGIKDFPGLTLAEGADPNVRKILMDAAVTGANGIIDAANASLAEQTAELDIAKAEEIRAAAIAKQSEENLRQLTKNADEKLKAAEASDDLRPFLGGEGSTQGWGRSIASIFALAVGGFLSGYTNTPNYVLKAFNDAMDRDIEEQKRKRTSMWNRYNDVLKNKEAAGLMVRADNNVLAQAYYKKMLATQDLGEVRPQAEKMLGELQRQLALDLSKVSGMMALEEFREAEAVRARRSPVVRPAAAPKGPSVAEQRLEEKKKKDERERLVNVADIPVRRATTQGQPKAQDDIDRRIAYVEHIAKLENAFQEYGADVYNVLATTRGEILGDLATLLENSPQGFGFARALSVNAGTVLKEGMGSPAGIKGAALKLFGRDPAAGIRAMRKDVQGQLGQKLSGIADPSNPRDKDAVQYGIWKVNNRIRAALKEKPLPEPKLSTPVDQILALPPDSPLYRPPVAAPDAPAPATATTPASDWRSKLKPVGKL
jgi:hypothetical protein